MKILKDFNAVATAMNNTPKHAVGFVSVAVALSVNLFVTIIKFFGAFYSGSSALFSEAVHSFADTLNQALLMIGIKRSGKKADEDFSYGYGRERFVWALISACGVFFIGAGITIYRGVSALSEHEAILIGPLIYAILIISFILESISLATAVRELRKASGERGIWKSFRQGDPSTMAIFYEDSVAVIGVLIAFASIMLTKWTGNPVWDGIGSILIGLLLGIVAVILINKNREFLIAKAIPDEVQKKVLEILESEPAIERVVDFKSAIIGIGHYRVKCDVEFNGSALLRELFPSGTLQETYDEVRPDLKRFSQFCLDYADRIPRVMGKKIDDIEARIQKQFPEIVHIDIEVN